VKANSDNTATGGNEEQNNETAPAAAPTYVTMLVIAQSAPRAIQLEATCRLLSDGAGLKTCLALSKADGCIGRIDCVERQISSSGCDILVSTWTTVNALLSRIENKKLSFEYTQYIVLDTSVEADADEHCSDNRKETIAEEDDEVQVLEQEMSQLDVSQLDESILSEAICDRELFRSVRGTYIIDSNSSSSDIDSSRGDCGGGGIIIDLDSSIMSMSPSQRSRASTNRNRLRSRSRREYYLNLPLINYADIGEVT
jgi:hypothetical protein